MESKNIILRLLIIKIIFILIANTYANELNISSTNLISNFTNVETEMPKKLIKTQIFKNELDELILKNKTEKDINSSINFRKENINGENQGNKDNNSIPIQLQKYLVCKRHCDKLNLIYNCGCDMDCVVYDDCCSMDLLEDCKDFHQEKYNYEVQLKALENKSKSNTASTVTNRNNEVILLNEDSCCNDSPPKTCSCDNVCEDYSDCCKDYKKCAKIDNIKLNKINIKDIKPDLANKEKSKKTINKADANSTIEILIDT